MALDRVTKKSENFLDRVFLVFLDKCSPPSPLTNLLSSITTGRLTGVLFSLFYSNLDITVHLRCHSCVLVIKNTFMLICGE